MPETFYLNSAETLSIGKPNIGSTASNSDHITASMIMMNSKAHTHTEFFSCRIIQMHLLRTHAPKKNGITRPKNVSDNCY